MKFCIALVIAFFFMSLASSFAQDNCVPFGGTIYGWHNGKTWYGEGNFTIGRKTLHANVVDVNTGNSKQGDMWLGTETATFDFGNGDKLDLMTEFVTEHQTDAVSAAGLFHVNEIGYFANGQGKFKNAWGRFASQGPFGPGVKLPPEIKPGQNDGLFWIGQYNGMICGVGSSAVKER